MNVMSLRQAYWANGYRPVAIYTKQKRPWGNGWRAEAFADPPLWVARQPLSDALSTGIATRPVLGIDIDVLDQPLCDRLVHGVERLAGISPLVRIGRAPKALLCYRCVGEPYRKLTTGDFILPDGSTAHVEILADGQQFVADGIHPDTNMPYQWTGATPDVVPLSDLPGITRAQAEAIIAMATELLAAAGRPKVAPRQERPTAAGDTFFTQVNSLALRNLAGWVRQVFPTAVYQAPTGAWRVHSRDRGRPDLMEDISFHPDGIRDYGLEQPLTPIDAVLAWNGANDPLQAALWLCQQCGLSPDALGFRSRPTPPPEPPEWPQEPEPERTPAPPPRIGRILTGEAFVNRHTPPDWLIDGLIQKGRLYACTSLTGHGKTAVWGLAACMIHAGRKFGSLEVTRGCVIYLAGENPTDLEARLIGIMNAYQIEPSQLPFVLPATFPMTDDECDALKKEIDALGVNVALIVGDTAASFFPGDDENDNVQAGAYARRLRSLTQLPGNPAIVVLSHPVKNAAADNLLPRGGGAFLNELDGNLALWSAEVGEITQLRDGGKLRGPPFNPLDFRLKHVETGLRDAKDRPEITVVAVPISENEAANQAKQTVWEENVVLKALHDRPGIAMADIAVAAGWVTATGLPEKWRVQRLIRSLATQKLISQPRKGMPWEINDLGRKAAGIPE